MKKILLAVSLVFLSFSVFAQEGDQAASSQKGSTYGRSIWIHRVASYRLGYKVWYYTNQGIDTTYIPSKWFIRAGAGSAHGVEAENRKGKVLQTRGRPYMQVFWKNGEFSHVILCLNISNSHVYDHPDWRLIEEPENWSEDKGTPFTLNGGEYTEEDLNSKFDVEELKLSF